MYNLSQKAEQYVQISIQSDLHLSNKNNYETPVFPIKGHYHSPLTFQLTMKSTIFQVQVESKSKSALLISWCQIDIKFTMSSHPFTVEYLREKGHKWHSDT